MAKKYSYNDMDNTKAMDILERARRVGRLGELMEKGHTFDWTGVPQYKSNLQKDSKNLE